MRCTAIGPFWWGGYRCIARLFSKTAVGQITQTNKKGNDKPILMTTLGWLACTSLKISDPNFQIPGENSGATPHRVKQWTSRDGAPESTE